VTYHTHGCYSRVLVFVPRHREMGWLKMQDWTTTDLKMIDRFSRLTVEQHLLARFLGISANTNENYTRYNFQAFANISRKIKFLENLQPSYIVHALERFSRRNRHSQSPR